MLFPRLRRKLRASRVKLKPYGRKNSFPFFLFSILVAVLLCIFLLSQKIGAKIVKMSEWIITDSIAILVNDAIYDEIEESGTDYNDIITFQKDSDGNITALSTNMSYVNKLQTKVVNMIYDMLPSAETEIIKVPLGNILGSKLFSGSEPYIPIKILSVTNVNPTFENNFTSAGINQTRHQILLNIDIELSVLVPGYTGIANVKTQVLIAETVIVGQVPNTYVDFN